MSQLPNSNQSVNKRSVSKPSGNKQSVAANQPNTFQAEHLQSNSAQASQQQSNKQQLNSQPLNNPASTNRASIVKQTIVSQSIADESPKKASRNTALNINNLTDLTRLPDSDSKHETIERNHSYGHSHGHSQAPSLISFDKNDAMVNKKIAASQPGKTVFWAEFKWFIALMLVGGVLGGVLGSLSWGIVAGLLLFYAWRSYAMQQFYTWLQQSVALPPPDFSGSLAFVASQLYDSKKQEQLAHQQTMNLIKKIRSSLLALQESVILIDKDDGLEWWNQSAEDLLELRSEDQGRCILDLINIPQFHEYYIDAVSPNEGVRFQSWRDPERYLQCEVTHFGDEKLLIIYDVTRLQHLEQMRKDFVGNVSHELRTPLTVIMGYIETFSDQPDLDPKWQRGFSLMAQQTRRMNSIINDLLLLSRLENEEMSKLECVDVPRMLAHIFDDAQVYNKEYGHLIDLHIDSQKNLYGSELYLNSALLNLVTNAIKYTPKSGEIAVSWQEVKGGCLFSVSDNGIGIAEEHIERLTERFYRVDSGRSRATGGTGLGLAIVKHVLYQHEAKLSIQSVEGKGSTFNVFFPEKRVCDVPTSHCDYNKAKK